MKITGNSEKIYLTELYIISYYGLLSIFGLTRLLIHGSRVRASDAPPNTAVKSSDYTSVSLFLCLKFAYTPLAHF